MKEENKQLKIKDKKLETKKTVSQKEIASEIATELKVSLETVEKIIDLEQRKTMERVKKGFVVVKKNYLTIKPYTKVGKTFHSSLTNKDYEIPTKNIVRVTVGDGFASFVSTKPMKDKLCRFVDNKENKQ